MMRERGFTLVSAIFLTVVLVALGASLMTISVVQHTTSAQMVQAVRANYAVRAGAEWAMAVSGAGGCPAGPTPLAPEGALSGFTIAVACARTDHDLPTGTQPYYVVDITAQSGAYGSPDFVLRRAQTKLLGPAP